KEIETNTKEKTGRAIYNAGSLPLTKQAEKVLKLTVLEAKVTKSDQIGTEHLILSILKHKDNLVSKTLSRYEVDYDVYKAELDYLKNQITSELSSDAGDDDPYEEEERARGGAGAQRKQGNVKSKTPVLDNFGRDVTKQAEEGS